MKFITITRLVICFLGLGLSTIILFSSANWIFYNTQLFYYITKDCLNSGFDGVECAFAFRYSYTYLATRAIICCFLGYFWFRLLTLKSKELQIDTLLMFYISILAVILLFKGSFENMLGNFLWPLFFTFGATVHFIISARARNKSITKEIQLE